MRGPAARENADRILPEGGSLRTPVESGVRHMNMIEKILARAGGRSKVSPGDVVVAEVDCALLHDLSGRSCRQVFEEKVGGELAHPERIFVIHDHLFSPPSEDKAEVLFANRQFCYKHGIKLYDCGSGNLHTVALENGHIRPGMVVVGSDSHAPVHGALGVFAASLGNDSYAATVMPQAKAWFRVPEAIHIELTGQTPRGTTARDVALWLGAEIGEGKANYQAIKFSGDYIDSLEIWDRWLFSLMAVDVGAKCAYIEPDAKTEAFVKAHTSDPFEVVRDDPGSQFVAHRRYDVSRLEPQICFPPTLGNVCPITRFVGTPIQWAELGGHGGGRSVDMDMAAHVFETRAKNPRVNFNLVPSTRQVFSDALGKGQVGLMHAKGATWFPPSTGGNQAVNMGAMAAGETMISTHVRNFPGRNGSPKASMFLGSALSVAAAATAGKIVDPREYL
jgi:3-isopropylmalate/(R)-2-methylmalate dehydratase large subunit